MEKTKKRILVLASTFPRWKNDHTPAFVFEIEKQLSKKYDIRVLAPHFPDAKKKESIEGLKVNRFVYFWPEKFQRLCYEGGILPNIKKNKLLLIQAVTLIFFEFLESVRLVKKQKIDLVHAHWIFPHGFIALVLKLLLKTNYVITVHGGDMIPFKRKNKPALWLYKHIIHNASLITSNNPVFCEEIKNLSGKTEVYFVPSGIDTHRFYPCNVKKTKNIIFVGRLAEKKGINYLIEALGNINIKYYDKLLIVGQGPLNNALIDKAAKMHLQNKTVFLGSIPYKLLLRLYNESRMAVFPSITTNEGDREGFPTVILEAMASGCPVITTNIEGMEKIFINGKNIMIVRQKNPKELAEAIIKLLKDASFSNYIVKNGQKEVTGKYSWKVIGKKYSKLISKL